MYAHRTRKLSTEFMSVRPLTPEMERAQCLQTAKTPAVFTVPLEPPEGVDYVIVPRPTERLRPRARQPSRPASMFMLGVLIVLVGAGIGLYGGWCIAKLVLS